MAKEKKLAIRRYEIDKPIQVAQMAKVLQTHIVRNNLYTKIVDKNYAHVEGWQFAGLLLGLRPLVKSVENLSTGQEVKWQAEVEILNRESGEVVGRGFAICSNKEAKKKGFDEYAVLSMAQTRAIGKAYRNLIGWVMKMAGYEGTPSEEMKKAGEEMPEPKEEVAQASAYKCSQKDCVMPVSKAVHDYSIQMYKKSLCKNHQPEK